MKKEARIRIRKIFAAMVALTVIMTYLPERTVLADPEPTDASSHLHCLCGSGEGAGCDHTAAEWNAWTDSGDLPKSAGRYYLTCDVNLTAEVEITADVAICLNGHTITAGENWGIFLVRKGGSLTLTDCSDTPGRLTGGNTEVGGAIYLFAGSKLYASNVTFSGNLVSKAGGAIYAPSIPASDYEGGLITTLTATNVTFSDNTCVPTASNNDGGAIFMGRGVHAELTGCTITGCRGKNASAIYALSTVDALVMEDCTVTGNSTTATGAYTGAVYMIAGGLTLRGKNVISANTDGAGRKIANLTIQNGDAGAKFTIENASELSRVGISFAKAPDGVVADVAGEFAGEFIWDRDAASLLEMADGKLCRLQPYAASGSLPSSGYWYLTGDVTFDTETALNGDLYLRLKGYKVAAASADAAAFAVDGGTDMKLSVIGEGGGFTSGQSIVRTAPMIRAAGTGGHPSISLRDLTVSGIAASAAGCAIGMEGSTALYMKSVTVSGCTVSGSGSSSLAPVTLTGSGEYLMEDCSFTGNRAAKGSAIYKAYGAALTLRGASIRSNTDLSASAPAGALICEGSGLTLSGTNVITGNFNSASPAAMADLYLADGAVTEIENDTAFSSVGFTAESVPERVAAVTAGEVLGTYTWTGDITKQIVVSGSDLVVDEQEYGNLYYNGKVYAPHMSLTTLPLQNPTEPGVDGWYLIGDVTVTTGHTVPSGKQLDLCFNGHYISFSANALNGALRTASGHLVMVNNRSEGGFDGRGTLAQSLLFTSASSSQSAYISAEGLRFTGFANNDNYGHMVVVQGQARFEFKNCTFDNNNVTSSSGGAAIYVNGAGSVTLDGCTFTGCSATNPGGAIYFNGAGEKTVRNCVFDGCVSNGSGGAFYKAGAGSISVSGSSFTDCASQVSGGAVCITGTGAGYLDDCTFTGCSAASYGGGAYFVTPAEGSYADGSTYTRCSALLGGGLCAAFGAELTVSGNTFDGCCAVSSGSDEEPRGSALYVAGSGTELYGGSVSVGDNTFKGNDIDRSLITVGSRGAVSIAGTLSAEDLTLAEGAALIEVCERGFAMLDGAVIRMSGNGDSIRACGTVSLKDTVIPEANTVVVDAACDLWEVQMNALARVSGDTRASVRLTKNETSWYSQQPGGSAEKAALAIQGENLGAGAQITVTIPAGDEIGGYVLGPAVITQDGGRYILTRDEAIPGSAYYGAGDGLTPDDVSVQLIIDENFDFVCHVGEDLEGCAYRGYLRGITEPVGSGVVTGGVITVPLAPDQLTAELSVTIDDSGTERTLLSGYSIAKYCDAVIEGLSGNTDALSESMRTLLAAVLRYGEDCQLYSGFNTAHLPSSGRAWVGQYLSDSTAKPVGDYARNDWRGIVTGASLMLEDLVRVRFAVNAAGTDHVTLSFTDDGENWIDICSDAALASLVTPIPGVRAFDTGSGFVLLTDGLTSTQYGRIFRLRAANGGDTAEVTYSVRSYIERKWDDTVIGSVVQDLQRLGEASESYRIAAQTGRLIFGATARDRVWNRMWEMATVVWSPSRTVYYSHQSELISARVFDRDKIYVGMPYTQSSGSIERFYDGFADDDSDGILDEFADWLPVPYDVPGDDNIDTIDLYMGNDCSGAVYWAASAVADVSFSVVRGMMPSNDCGLVFPVVEGAKPLSCTYTEGGSIKTETAYSSTIIEKSIGALDDEATKAEMFKYYAALQKGDILAGTAPGNLNKQNPGYIYGHCMLVESVDAEHGEIVVLQHGSMGGANAPGSHQGAYSNASGLGRDLNLSWTDKYRANYLWNYGVVTFEDLFSNYYIPLTLPEYGEGSHVCGEASVDNTHLGKLYLASGIVTSERYRLQSANIRIYDADGTLVGSPRIHTATYRWGMYSSSKPQRLIENSMDLAAFVPYITALGLQEGRQYRYELWVHLSNGEDLMLKGFRFRY